MEWKKINYNFILDGDGFFISYLPNSANVGGMGGLFAGDTMQETAIVVKKDSGNKYYILNGDWRKHYELLAPQGLEACMTLFNSEKEEHSSSWSN